MKSDVIKKIKLIILGFLLLIFLISCVYIISFFINRNKTEEPKNIIEKIDIDDIEQNNKETKLS